MLQAVVSGDKAKIFKNLLRDVTATAHSVGMPGPALTPVQYLDFIIPLTDRRISHVITLSTDN